MLWITATVYGIQVLYDILKLGFRIGFAKVFHWKVMARPSCLDDPALGTHGYLHLEVIMFLTYQTVRAFAHRSYR